MKIFAVTIAILVLFIGWAKPVNFGMAVHTMTKNASIGGTALMVQVFEMSCGASVCATVLAVQKAADDCVRHCIQSALPAVGEIAAFVIAPFIHFNAIVLITLAGLLAEAVFAYAFVRYLLYAYTLFHLRFVTSTVLRD